MQLAFVYPFSSRKFVCFCDIQCLSEQIKSPNKLSEKPAFTLFVYLDVDVLLIIQVAYSQWHETA